MAAQLKERILAVIESKLLSSGGSLGYLPTPELSVHRPPVEDQALSPADTPAISIRSGQRDLRKHLRGAEESIIPVVLICTAATAELLIPLMGYARAVVYANQRWNDGTENLAQRTWITDDTDHETEVSENTKTGQVNFSILARADLADLTQVKAI